MIDINKNIERGKLLVSEPFLSDPYFKRSVVLLSEHNNDGSIGFILNKPTDIKLNEAIRDFPILDSNLYFGGPVQTDSLQYIHKLGDKLEGSKEVMKGVFWGGNFENLKMLIDTKQVSPEEIRFFVGYSGWQPNQLEDEIKEKSWIIAPSTNQFAFFDHPKKLWGDVLRSLGQEFSILANFPEDPSLN